MLLDAPSVTRLTEALRRLPGVGKRSAERMAMHILGADEAESLALSNAVREARHAVKRCRECRNLTEIDPCRVCSDPSRNHTVVCVVEHPSGAMAIERGGGYHGLYHVLHGALNPLEGIGPDELELAGLLRRIEAGGIEEVIVATNATAEGEATAMYIAKQVARLGVTASRIAHGVPMGSGLEYADDMTLSLALEGRQRLQG